MSSLGARANINSTHGIEPNDQNSNHQEDAKNTFNQEIVQVSKNEFKKNKSHSVWSKSENTDEHCQSYDLQFLILHGFFYTSTTLRDLSST